MFPIRNISFCHSDIRPETVFMGIFSFPVQLGVKECSNNHYDFVNCLLKVVEVVKNQENLGIKVCEVHLAYVQGLLSLGKNERKMFLLGRKHLIKKIIFQACGLMMKHN